MRGVLAPLTNVLGRTRPRSLSPSSSDSDVHSDGDEDIQPVGARIGHDYNPRPIYILRSSFRYKLELADGTTRTEKEIENRMTSNNCALQAFVPSYSFAGAVTGTRLKAALTHR